MTSDSLVLPYLVQNVIDLVNPEFDAVTRAGFATSDAHLTEHGDSEVVKNRARTTIAMLRNDLGLKVQPANKTRKRKQKPVNQGVVERKKKQAKNKGKPKPK